MPPVTESQQMEMDMVQGMYDTYSLLSEDPPSYAVLLAATTDDAPGLRVTVTYPSEAYPDAAPCQVVIECISKRHRIQVAKIMKEVAATCEENVGMHTVIIALQQVHDFLAHAVAEAEQAELTHRGEAMAAASNTVHVVDPTIRVGTAVTRELFEEWSRNHRLEKTRVRAENERQDVKASASKLTGRQLWDSTLKAADWELFGGADEKGEDVDFDALGDMDEYEFDLEDADVKE